MKTIELTDGHKLNFPDDTDSDVIERARRSTSIRRGLEPATVGKELTKRTAAAELAASNPNLWDKFWLGVGDVTREAGQGIKGAVMGRTPQERNALETSHAITDAAGPMGTVGRIAGGTAMYALPMTGAAMALPATAARVAAPALGATIGALTTPENRGRAAALGAVGTAVPAAIGAGGRYLEGKGVDLTLKKAMDAGSLRNLRDVSLAGGGLTTTASALGLSPSQLASYLRLGAYTGGGLLGVSKLHGAAPALTEGLGYGAAETLRDNEDATQ